MQAKPMGQRLARLGERETAYLQNTSDDVDIVQLSPDYSSAKLRASSQL